MEIPRVLWGVFHDPVCPPRQEGWQGKYCTEASSHCDTETLDLYMVASEHVWQSLIIQICYTIRNMQAHAYLGPFNTPP